MSTQVQTLGNDLLSSLEHNDEFMSLSIDCTLMSIQGQASHRPSSAVRNAACFDDAHSLRRVLTIRGRTGAVVAMHLIPREDSDQVAEAMDTLFVRVPRPCAFGHCL